MKNLITKLILVLTSLMFLYSCSIKEQKSIYPRYSLEKVEHLPDSLKVEYREWLVDIVKAASQHMTGGDYEDVDRTIAQAERTANRIFKKSIIGLKMELNKNYYDDISLKPSEMNLKQKRILDSLKNN